jgi:hypothetical protein
MGKKRFKCKVCRQESEFEFCSPWCRKEHEKQKKHLEWDKEAHCSECGNVFIKPKRNRKTCSKECAEARKARKSGEIINEAFVILQRDGFRCQYCGESAREEGIKLVLDHVSPCSKGGSHTAGNLITACEACNISKGAETLPKALLKEVLDAVDDRNRQQGISPDRKIRCSATRGRGF